MKFDMDLKHKIIETMLRPLGVYVPNSRILYIGYKQNGVDTEEELEVCDLGVGLDDNGIVRDVMEVYAAEGKTLGCIIEVDREGHPIEVLYADYEYLNELGVIK